jgi:hypothetical protein
MQHFQKHRGGSRLLAPRELCPSLANPLSFRFNKFQIPPRHPSICKPSISISLQIPFPASPLFCHLCKTPGCHPLRSRSPRHSLAPSGVEGSLVTRLPRTKSRGHFPSLALPYKNILSAFPVAFTQSNRGATPPAFHFGTQPPRALPRAVNSLYERHAPRRSPVQNGR